MARKFKTSALVKGLTETRARVAGEVERYTTLVPDLVEKFAKAQAELDACDLFIRKLGQGIDPVSILRLREALGTRQLRSQG